jgi:predicted dehydrogenase
MPSTTWACSSTTHPTPASITAEIANIYAKVPTDDNGVAILRFPNGAIGELLNSSTTLAAVNTTEIYGDEGTLIQDYGDAPSTASPRPAGVSPLRLIRKGETKWTEFDLPIPQSQAERLMNVPRPFVDYVRGLTDQTVSAEEGRVTIEMLVAAYQSAREGRRIALPLSTHF